MKKEKMASKVEVHICNFERNGEASCFEKGAKQLTDNLKKWAKENHSGSIKVIRSGCLGKCSEGIAISCYPEKNLLLEVKPDDEAKIKEGLIEALSKV